MTPHALPLDFSLRNANDESVLVLGGPQDLTLKIRNNCPTPLFLNPLTQAHHFSLRFRAGVLHDHRNIGLDEAQLKHWDIDAREEQGDVVVGLRHKAPMSWAPDRTLHLRLEGLRGELAGGTRATRVELSYDHIRNQDKDGALIAGKPRHHQMVLTMSAPQGVHGHPLLEAHFVGATGNVVLNDGQLHPYSIDLRLTNTTAERLHVRQTAAFHLSLADGAQDLPGALANHERLHQYLVSAHVVRDASVAESIPLDCRLVGMQPVEWMLRAPENAGDDLWLGPAGYVEIKIEQIVTAHRNGPSNLQVRWVNLGYLDRELGGQATATLQKSPLVVVGRKVGIGSIPTRDGPDLDNETMRLALARATTAMQAVVSTSIRGHVEFGFWEFNDIFGFFRWPTIKWTALDVYWPPSSRRHSIPMRDLTQKDWRRLFAWFKDYPNPGYPMYFGPNEPFFRRSPYELFFLYDPPDAMYLDGPRDDESLRILQVTYAEKKAQRRSEMGLPLKPYSSLYARIDLEGTADASQAWVTFEASTLPEETRPHDWVFIARWDEKGVTTGCDFNFPSSELRAVGLPPPQPPSP